MAEGDKISFCLLGSFTFSDEDEWNTRLNFLGGTECESNTVSGCLSLHEFVHALVSLDGNGEAVGANRARSSGNVEFSAIVVAGNVFSLFNEEASTTTVLVAHTLPYTVTAKATPCAEDVVVTCEVHRAALLALEVLGKESVLAIACDELSEQGGHCADAHVVAVTHEQTSGLVLDDVSTVANIDEAPE